MFRFIKTALRAWFDGFTTTGKFWLSLGIAALVVDAAIAYQFGVTMTGLHGAGFALVAIFFALLPDASYTECEKKRWGSGVALGLLCIPLGAVAFYSHLGYGAGVRLGDIQQTGVQNVRHDDARRQVADNEANLAMWRDHLAKLEAENAWVATVSADGLRAQVAAAQEAVDQEARRGGCGPRCLALMKDKAGLEERVALAEQASDLTRRIEATQRKVDEYRALASAVDFRSSEVVNQTSVAAQLFLAFTGAAPEQAIDPDQVTTSFTNIFIAGGGSLAFMIMAPVGFFVAGRNRKPERDEASDPAPAQEAAQAARGDISLRQLAESKSSGQDLPAIHLHESRDDISGLLERVRRLAAEHKQGRLAAA